MNPEPVVFCTGRRLCAKPLSRARSSGLDADLLLRDRPPGLLPTQRIQERGWLESDCSLHGAASGAGFRQQFPALSALSSASMCCSPNSSASEDLPVLWLSKRKVLQRYRDT